MILITGATGNYGGTVVDFLLEKKIEANQIAVLLRNLENAEKFIHKGVNLKIGDYNDYSSLVNAFDDVDKILFVSGSDLNSRIAQHENVIKAAKIKEVKHIVYTSFQRKSDASDSPLGLLAQSHLQTEKWLKDSGIDYTILKNNLYMEYMPSFIGEKVLENEAIYLPAGKGKISTALRSEFAEATANILASSGHQNKTYDFTNVKAYSYLEIAKIISEITGQNIQYFSPSIEEFRETLSNLNVPEEGIDILAGFSLAQQQEELDLTSSDLENLLGRKPTSLEAFLEKVYANNNNNNIKK